MAEAKQPDRRSEAEKTAGDALDELKKAVELCGQYRQENLTLVTTLQMISKLAREGGSLPQIADLADRAVLEAKKKK